MTTPHPTAAPRRAGWAILVVVSALWLGFGAGMFAAGRWLVPAGSGLAGPAIAVAYGLGAAAIAGVASAVAAWKAPLGSLRVAALIAMILGLLLTALLIVGVVMRASAV
jgi:hypothetical protein